MFSSVFSAKIASLSNWKWQPSGWSQWQEVLRRNWYLGLSSFGGPAVHFQIFRRLFVEKHKWLDDKMYQELFALCQALPGPGSTKMIYCINVIHSGFVLGFLAFLVWSLPSAVASYGLALGTARINQRLPDPVCALLSGLNAAVVGIIALAAVQLSQKAITDKISRVLVFFGATAGVLYNALWYFPVLMLTGGLSTIAWDYRLPHRIVRRLRLVWKAKRAPASDPEAHNNITELAEAASAHVRERENQVSVPHHCHSVAANIQATHHGQSSNGGIPFQGNQQVKAFPEALNMRMFSWQIGITIIVGFFITFTVIMVLRGTLANQPRGFRLFANLCLAGTIIFGGGPVVIPLLREYVVAEGWVSARDFLLGLAIIQAFPGPNFNFAVYLGALAVQGTSLPMSVGALIGYIAIFAPGLILHTGTMGIWHTLRGCRWLTSCLRGINAVAVGLVYTAVFRLWRIGYIDSRHQQGNALEQEAWWVVVTATSFVGGMWFRLQAPVAILLGGAMGMVRYGIVGA